MLTSTCSRALPDGLAVRMAYCVGSDDVVLQEDLCYRFFDQLEHDDKRVRAVSQQSDTISPGEGTARHAGQPILESWIERADRVKTAGRFDHLERRWRLPFAGMFMTGAAHPAALLQERADPSGVVCARLNQGRLHLRKSSPGASRTGSVTMRSSRRRTARVGSVVWRIGQAPLRLSTKL
jgi:hypothetical protein